MANNNTQTYRYETLTKGFDIRLIWKWWIINHQFFKVFTVVTPLTSLLKSVCCPVPLPRSRLPNYSPPGCFLYRTTPLDILMNLLAYILLDMLRFKDVVSQIATCQLKSSLLSSSTGLRASTRQIARRQKIFLSSLCLPSFRRKWGRDNHSP